MKSLLSRNRECYICGTVYNLHKHHIIHGTANRKMSEKYGCWCYLCFTHHNGSNKSVHMDSKMDIELKERCQREFEKKYTRNDWRRIFGRSYL